MYRDKKDVWFHVDSDYEITAKRYLAYSRWHTFGQLAQEIQRDGNTFFEGIILTMDGLDDINEIRIKIKILEE